MDLIPLEKATEYFPKGNEFWKSLVEHPNYDSYWQKRSILPHLKNVKTNVLTVGGLFDAEDLYGPLNIYSAIEANNPNTFNAVVMGPWSHGDWAQRGDHVQRVGKIPFGANIALTYHCLLYTSPSPRD